MSNDPQRAPFKPDPRMTFAAALGEAYAGRNPTNALIEAEAAGQSSFVNSTTLPSDMQGGRPILEAAGVVITGPVLGDDLFVYVTLPAGWRKVATDHDMWSSLVDDKGRIRASIFYKAAFYDCRAFLSANRRYSIDRDFDRDDVIVTHVKDGITVIFTSQEYVFDEKYSAQYNGQTDRAFYEARAWLEQHYPNWQDASQYWD